MAVKSKNEKHVYDANLDPQSDLQRFFEGDNLVVATRFFRNAELFRHLGTMVIPNLLKSGLQGRGSLHIWSAGCSDGREAYSLAMAARTILDDRGRQDVAVKVRGSDLSRPQIELARRGVYRIGPNDRPTLKPYGQYFEELGENIWQIANAIKDTVEFVVEDIIEARMEAQFDILICSLVLLYYQPRYQHEIIQQLIKAVRPGGYFHVAPVGRRWLKTQGFEPLLGSSVFFTSRTMKFLA
jgi:chemotaxis methyl-accepting protein methylase